VDAQTVSLMWAELEEAGRAEELRATIRQMTQIRR
jgi:hypothetical protein